MYAITGITGQVGGAVARTLLDHKLPVRAVVRDARKGAAWAELGCEVALAEMGDAAALGAAFKDATAVFILPPANFDPEPDFPADRAVVTAVRSALEAARPARAVCLSTIGAQATQTNLLTARTIMEQALGELTLPVAFLRPGWFMENAAWDVAAARDTGVISSYLYPLDRSVPMVATADVGRVAAELLQQTWTGRRVVELEGPRRISPNDIAASFGALLGRSVHAQVVARETWAAAFTAGGMKNPTPRMRMLDGFNEGWIDFEGAAASVAKGKIELETVLKALIEQSAKNS